MKMNKIRRKCLAKEQNKRRKRGEEGGKGVAEGTGGRRTGRLGEVVVLNDLRGLFQPK